MVHELVYEYFMMKRPEAFTEVSISHYSKGKIIILRYLIKTVLRAGVVMKR